MFHLFLVISIDESYSITHHETKVNVHLESDMEKNRVVSQECTVSDSHGTLDVTVTKVNIYYIHH